MYTVLTSFEKDDVDNTGLKGTWKIVKEPNYCWCGNKNYHIGGMDAGRVWKQYTLMLFYHDGKYMNKLCKECAVKKGFTIPHYRNIGSLLLQAAYKKLKKR